MAEYTLVYFNARGRAETARLLFAVAGVEYTDKRVTKEEWAELKADPPFHQLPYLEVKGKKLPQSAAIVRFLAEEFDMFGKDKLQKATIDVVTECLRDLEGPMISWYYEKDETKKETLKKELYEQKVPAVFKALEKQLCQSNEGNGWLVGDKISLADISFFNFIEWLTPGNPDVLGNSSKLKTLHERIQSHEPVAAWLEKRPKTEF